MTILWSNCYGLSLSDFRSLTSKFVEDYGWAGVGRSVATGFVLVIITTRYTFYGIPCG